MLRQIYNIGMRASVWLYQRVNMGMVPEIYMLKGCKIKHDKNAPFLLYIKKTPLKLEGTLYKQENSIYSVYLMFFLDLLFIWMV